MKSILETCTPRSEVLKGDLEDAIFAADFGYVVENILTTPAVYRDPVEFFRNTHPAAPLKKVMATIFGRLADPAEAGAAVRLSTGFGGGKTHTLIALWHLARHSADATLGADLLPPAGRLREVAVAGIDAQKFGTSVCATHGTLHTHSLWGELAFQLGGLEGYAAFQALDDPLNVPHDAIVRAMLPAQPTLILLDELVIYMAQLSEQAQGALLSFLSKLIAEVGARRQAVLVMTDPGRQPAYEKESAALTKTTQQLAAAQRLDDVLGRKLSDYDPIGNETAQVIIRRLFEHVAPAAAQTAAAEYYNAYERVAAEYPDVFPQLALAKEYAHRIVDCYPFHPRLLETAQDRLGALQDFNKSRGTLRFFARILRDVWESGAEMPLVSAGDLNWQSARIQADLLQRLNRDTFAAAVNADVVRHAGQLDADYGTDVHRRVATALLLESLPLTAQAALDKAELTLAILRPGDVGHEPGEALDRLMSVCWHTYKDDTGRRFQFRYDPNANKIIEERAEAIPLEDARSAVETLARAHFSGHTFSLREWPAGPRAVSDSAELKLVLAESVDLAQRICDYEDDSDPEAPRPRRFRNAILSIAPTPALLTDAMQVLRRQKAAEQLAAETKRGTPLYQQVSEQLPLLRKRARLRAIQAFNRVVFQGRPSVTLDGKYQVSEDSALDTVSGQGRLKQFLDDTKKIYQPGDVLDVDLVLELLPGCTPALDHPGAYPASALHERALASPKLRLLLNPQPLRDAILKGVQEGKLVVRLPSGAAYDQAGYVHDVGGYRQRASGTLSTLALTSDVLVALVGAPCTETWLAEDTLPDAGDAAETLPLRQAAQQKGVPSQAIQDALDAGQLDYALRDGQRHVVVNDRFGTWEAYTPREASAATWDQALHYAARRPLLTLEFRAADPAAADKLLACAQPFGARDLALTVQVSGALKEGGQVNFAVQGVKPNHALKPLDEAKKLLRGAAENYHFAATLTLTFDAPQTATAAKFEQAQAQAVPGLTLDARFGEEG